MAPFGSRPRSLASRSNAPRTCAAHAGLDSSGMSPVPCQHADGATFPRLRVSSDPSFPPRSRLRPGARRTRAAGTGGLHPDGGSDCDRIPSCPGQVVTRRSPDHGRVNPGRFSGVSPVGAGPWMSAAPRRDRARTVRGATDDLRAREGRAGGEARRTACIVARTMVPPGIGTSGQPHRSGRDDVGAHRGPGRDTCLGHRNRRYCPRLAPAPRRGGPNIGIDPEPLRKRRRRCIAPR